MTPQGIFDTVATHLLTQGVKSKGSNREGEIICSYRGENGTKCAAGCLIKDNNYTTEMEGLSWIELTEKFRRQLDKSLLGTKAFYLIRDLQRIHDQTPEERWPESLVGSARCFDLDPKVVLDWGKK